MTAKTLRQVAQDLRKARANSTTQAELKRAMQEAADDLELIASGKPRKAPGRPRVSVRRTRDRLKEVRAQMRYAKASDAPGTELALLREQEQWLLEELGEEPRA